MEFFVKHDRPPVIEAMLPAGKFHKHIVAYEMDDGSLHYEEETVKGYTGKPFINLPDDGDQAEYFYAAMRESAGAPRTRPSLTVAEATERLQRAREEAARAQSTTTFFGPLGDSVV